MPKLLAALATMNPLSPGCVESVMVIPSPLEVSASATESRSPELKNETSVLPTGLNVLKVASTDRKSTRLNSSHQIISYAVFCLKKKNKKTKRLSSHTARC